MSQHDMNIANQGFPSFRSDLNDALQALGTQSSGATAPTTTFANQIWYDTANNIVKQRNEDNDAWISLFTLDQTADSISQVGSLVLANAVTLAGSQTLTNKTLTTPVINGFTSDTSVVNIGSGQIYKDTSGNTGFGTTSPTDAVHARKSSGSTYLKAERATQSGGEVGVSIAGGSGGVDWSVYQPSGSNSLTFYGAGADRLSINSSGVLSPLAGQIKFPATQNASSDANTLDDYEEGTWTPSIAIGSATFNNCKYTKIGRLVTICGYIQNFTDRSSSSSVAIGGLPFTANTQTENTGAVFGRYLSNSISACYFGGGATFMYFYNVSSGAFSPLQHSQLNNALSELYFTLTYQASA